MSLQLICSIATPASRCPYRLHDANGEEIGLCNEFLDAQLLRNLSPRSLRSYAYDLLHFARWWWRPTPPPLSQIDEAALADYVRFQIDQHPSPSVRTVNHRLTVVRALLRFHLGTRAITSTAWERTVMTYPPIGIGRRRCQLAATLRLREARRIMVPLSAEEVEQFWRSFRAVRDLALVGLMLFNGLRSHEVLGLQLEDVRLGEAQLLVRGKECHSYCISFRRRNETTIIHACRQACDLAFSVADVFLAGRTGIGLGPCTDADGVGRVGPMCEPFPA